MSKFVQILRSVSFPLGRVGVGLLLLALAACKTTSQAPLDDAYYWPDKSAQITTTPSNNAKQAEGSNSQTPSNNAVVEYTNVQDTTVTIRIKR